MKTFCRFSIVVFLLTFPIFAQNNIETFRKNASDLSDQRKFAEAAAEIGKAIELEPNNADLYLKRAQFYWLAKNDHSLLSDVQRAVSINPTDKMNLYSGAMLLQRSGNYREALNIANSLFALGEPDYSAWQLMIQIKTHLEDFIGAFEDASTAMEMFPNEAVFKQNQANLIRLLGNSDKAIELYTSLIPAYEKKLNAEKDENKMERLRNDLTQFLFSRARIYFENFKKDLAFADLNRAVEILPIDRIYYQRARHYIMFKMYAEALPDLNKAIELGDKNAGFNFFLDRGDVFFRLGKYKEAIQDYERVIKLQDSLTEPMQRRIAQANQKLLEASK